MNIENALKWILRWKINHKLNSSTGNILIQLIYKEF